MKFSIVTPTYNSERFLTETIMSVISQKGDFSLEYIIVDNFSKDRTSNIVQNFQEMLESRAWPIRCTDIKLIFIQAKDYSMYEAINNGFANASGDIYAWINSDDIYLPGAFDVIAKTFDKYCEIKWLKGITSYINVNSTIWEIGICRLYNQEWIQKGLYGRELYFIQQDSVFWRAELWKKTGGILSGLKRAGDFYLWIKFAEVAPLFTLDAYISCFRKVEGQISQDLKAYRLEMESICPRSQNLIKLIGLYFNRIEPLLPMLLKTILYCILLCKSRFKYIGNDISIKYSKYYLTMRDKH